MRAVCFITQLDGFDEKATTGRKDYNCWYITSLVEDIMDFGGCVCMIHCKCSTGKLKLKHSFKEI